MSEETETKTENPVDSLSLLDYTQGIRKRITDEMIKDGIPTSEDDIKLVLAVAKDMDTTSTNRMRLDIDSEANHNDKQAQEIVRQMLKQNPYGLRQEEPVRDAPPEVDVSAFEEFKHADGEDYVGLESESVSEFMARMDDETGHSS